MKSAPFQLSAISFPELLQLISPLANVHCSTVPPCHTSCSKAAIKSSDLHFKLQLESSQFKASQKHGQSHFCLLNNKGYNIHKAVPVLSRDRSEEGTELEHGARVFVPVISRDGSVPGLPSPRPALPHHTTAAAMLGAAGAPPSSK